MVSDEQILDNFNDILEDDDSNDKHMDDIVEFQFNNNIQNMKHKQYFVL